MKRTPLIKKLGKRKCKNCGVVFQKKRPIDPACSMECLIKLAKKKVKKDFEKQCRDEKKAFYKKEKSLGEYEKEAKEVFQLWVRMRDNDKPCPSCGTEFSDVWDGGHYLAADKYSGLIFNEKNCHKQCRQCNFFKHGNELMYRDGLIKRYGESYVKELEDIKDVLRYYKYTKDELIQIKKHYKLKIKQLKR